MRKVIPIKRGSTANPSATTDSQPADYRSLGDAHRDARRWAEAASAYSRYLEAKPGEAAIWIQAGNCWKEAGNFAGSLAAYRKAEELEPRNSEVHLQLGHLYKVCGRFSAALASYERAAVLDPGFGEIRHEIRDLTQKMKSVASGTPMPVDLFASVDELIEALRNLPAEDDPFASYFRSIGGPGAGWRA